MVNKAVVRLLVAGVLTLVVTFMIVPTILVGILSFSSDSFIKFPPHSWGWREYATLISSPTWQGPLLRSLTLAAIVAPASVTIGLMGVLAVYRTAMPARNALQMLAIGPLLAPGVAYAMALYTLFTRIHLLGTLLAIVLAHIALTVPFVMLITGAAINGIPRDLELAALSLGASRFRVWIGITFRLLLPAIVASLIFAFVTSLDETVITSFLSSAGYVTLPVAIFNSVRYGVDPVITAIATLLTLATAVLLSIYAFIRRSPTRGIAG